MTSVTRLGLGVSVYLVALLAWAPGALANHLMAMEAQSDTDTNFILNVPVSVQKLGERVTSVAVVCSLSHGGHVIAGAGPGAKGGGGASRPLSKEVPFDRFTGSASGTVTFRLSIVDPRRSQEEIRGPMSATCRLRFPGTRGERGEEGPIVGPPTGATTSKGGAERFESAHVKPGSTVEVSGNFP